MSKKKKSVNIEGEPVGGGGTGGQGVPGTTPGIPPGFQIPVDPNLPTVPGTLPSSLTGPGYKGSANAPFVPIDPNALENLAVQFDTKGYNLSDADWAARFPQLEAGRSYGIQSAQTNLAGHPDPYVTSEMNRGGYGNVNFGSNEYQQARNLGMGITDKENRDRNYFATLLKDNPQRAFGLNSNDIANIALANTGAQNAQSQAKFQSNLNAYNASVQQGIQNTSAIIGGVGKVGGAIISNPYVDSSLSPGGYFGYGYPATSSISSPGTITDNAFAGTDMSTDSSGGL